MARSPATMVVQPGCNKGAVSVRAARILGSLSAETKQIVIARSKRVRTRGAGSVELEGRSYSKILHVAAVVFVILLIGISAQDFAAGRVNPQV